MPSRVPLPDDRREPRPPDGEKLRAQAVARGRRDAMRSRAARIRRRVAAGTAALFAAAFLGIYVQLASGHDPALDAAAKRQSAAAVSTSASRSSESSAAKKRAEAESKATAAASEESTSGSESSGGGESSSSSEESSSSSASGESESSSPSPVTTSQS